MIKVDIRSENSAYITIGKWVIYVDDSTGEQIIDSWEEWNTNSKSNLDLHLFPQVRGTWLFFQEPRNPY